MTRRQRLQPLGDAERIRFMVEAGGREGIDYPLSAQNVPGKFGMSRSEWEWRLQTFGTNFTVYLLHVPPGDSVRVYAIPAADFKRELDQELDGEWEQTAEGERLTIDLPINRAFIRIRARSPKTSERLRKATYERRLAPQRSRVRVPAARARPRQEKWDDFYEYFLYQAPTYQFDASELSRLFVAAAQTGDVSFTKACLQHLILVEASAKTAAAVQSEFRRVRDRDVAQGQ